MRIVLKTMSAMFQEIAFCVCVVQLCFILKAPIVLSGCDLSFFMAHIGEEGHYCELLNTYLINSYFCGPSSGGVFCPSSSIGGNDLFLPKVIIMSPELSGDARQIETHM